MRFPQCEFPLLADAEAIRTVRAAVEAGGAFSMVRIGDGEGVLLSVGDDTWLRDLNYITSHWGADNVTWGDLAAVRDDLTRAIAEADLVGIRNDMVSTSVPDDLMRQPVSEVLGYVRENIHLRPKEAEVLSAAGARRLAVLSRVLSRLDWHEGQQFCSQWLHWELLSTGALNEILAGVDRVGLVTSKPELEHMVARQFGVKTIVVEVPEKFVEGGTSGAHVPTKYRVIRDELDFPDGTLVLVGAGIPGKVYCQWIKEMGGIAIDIGAVLDVWVGKASRPLILETHFQVAGGSQVPSELQLREHTSPSRRQLVPRWKPERLAK